MFSSSGLSHSLCRNRLFSLGPIVASILKHGATQCRSITSARIFGDKKTPSDGEFCYECDEPGHTKNNCPVVQKNREEAKIRLRAVHRPVEKHVEDLLASQRISTGINFDLQDEIHVEITKPVDYTPLK
uniref:CCHC-type domain-containing protein n=1 Tax=Romanomermis culicivorax TaxID=13658 RepID=A0A915KEZ6_ROMCU